MALPRPERITDDYQQQVEEESDQERNERLIALLDSWINVTEEEAEEQRETLEYLIRVLDEDRLSDRKLFPEGWDSFSTRGRSA